MAPREKITPKGVSVDIIRGGRGEEDFISLTGIAKYKNADAPADLIKNWLRSRSTMEFLGLWEQLNNNAFRVEKFEEYKNEAGSNSFVMSPKKWIEDTNAKGIISQSGRYGGTYAHSDIAFEFASWISSEFKLYLIRDYQQLKSKENSTSSLEWNLNRTLSKINYKVHTEAIKANLIPPTLSRQQAGYRYANEADRLNVALFGMTAKEWKQDNTDSKGNLRDNASIEQLLVLTNLESMNAELIKQGRAENERTEALNKMAREQMSVLVKDSKILEKLSNEESRLE